MLIVIVVGAVTGLMLGLTGAGGGVLAVPLLVVLAGQGTPEAITLSLVGIGAVSLAGSLRNAWRREVPWRSAAPVAVAAMLGAPIGTWIGTWLPESVLTVAFVLVSLTVAALMWRGGCHGRQPEVDTPPVAETRDTALGVVGAGLATGVLAGVFGVGGGFLLVPALVFVAGQPMRRAAIISLVVITVSTVMAVMSRVLADVAIPWQLGGALAAAGVVTFVVGDAIARRMRPCRLREVFALALAAVLIVMLVDHFRDSL